MEATNRKPRRRKQSEKAEPEALVKAGGNAAEAARALGTSRSSVRHYIETRPEIRQIVIEQRNELANYAEAGLLDAVQRAKQGSEQVEADDTLKLSAEPRKKTKRGTAVRGTKGWDDAMVRARGQAEQYAQPSRRMKAGRRPSVVRTTFRYDQQTPQQAEHVMTKEQ